MKTASRVLCALLVLCMAASGAGPVLVITDGGYQIMSVGSDGKAVLTAVGSVVDMRGTPGPGPTPPDVTTDPIASQVKGWSDAVGDPTTRQALAEVYKRVGESSAGQPREKVLAALRDQAESFAPFCDPGSAYKRAIEQANALLPRPEDKGGRSG